MNTDNVTRSQSRSLEHIFKAHLENSIECGQVLSQLFLHLHEPEQFITEIKHFEERGDKLTAEVYDALELLPYSELVQLVQQFVNHLDDIVDGMNNTARLIDVLAPTTIEEAVQQLLAITLSMISSLLTEIERYSKNQLASVRHCRETLKEREQAADQVYHEWRKAHRRRGNLSLIDETDWTEILGILEQTTDACYHAALLLERITKHHLRHLS